MKSIKEEFFDSIYNELRRIFIGKTFAKFLKVLVGVFFSSYVMCVCVIKRQMNCSFYFIFLLLRFECKTVEFIGEINFGFNIFVYLNVYGNADIRKV